MEPIIAPSTFYWIDVISTFSTISTAIFGFSVAALLLAFIFLIIFVIENELKGYFGKFYKKFMIMLTIITTISGLSCVFTPSKETLIAMTVAQYVTPDNIEAIGGTVEDGISYITSEVVRVVEAANNQEAANDKEDTKSD